MTCEETAPAVVPVNAERIVSPPAATLPSIVNCCVGAAFQRTMPPNAFKPRLSLASVIALDRCGPVVASVYGIVGAARAAVAGSAGASELGAFKELVVER